MLDLSPVLLAKEIGSAVAEAIRPAGLLLTNAEAAVYTGLSETVWRTAKAKGELPKPVKVPGRTESMYRKSDLDAWVLRLPKATSALPKASGTATGRPRSA